MFCEQCGIQIGDGQRLCQKCLNNQIKKKYDKNGFPMFLIIFGFVLLLSGFIAMHIRVFGIIIGILALIVSILIFLLKQKIKYKVAIILTITGSLILLSNLRLLFSVPNFWIIREPSAYFLIYFLSSIGLEAFGWIKLLKKGN